MVILKKIKAATLIETLTASALIIIVFMIASLSFNNVFGNYQRRDRSAIENHIRELEYLYIHDQIKLPFAEDFGSWEIEITMNEEKATLRYSNKNKTYKKRLAF